MNEFIIQVLATLFSAFVVFCVGKITKWIKKIPKRKLYNVLMKSIIIISYLIGIEILVINLKILLKLNFSFLYILVLINLSFSFYTLVKVSVLIKENISEDCFEEQE